MTITRHVSYNADLQPFIELAARDFGSFSRFVQTAVVAYGQARIQLGEAPTTAQLEAAILRAQLQAADESDRARRIDRELKEARLEELSAILAAREAAGETFRSPEELLDAIWGRLPPIGGERSRVLKELAEDHGIHPRKLARAAAERLRSEAAGQTNLRVIPRKEASQ